MDGISSVASIVQLGEAVKKLVDFCKDVRDAPATITCLFNDLKLLSEIIAKSRRLYCPIEPGDTTDRVLQACEKRISELHSKIDKSVQHFKTGGLRKRFWTSFLVTCKASELKSLQGLIRDANQRLSQVQQIFLIESALRVISNQEQIQSSVDALHLELEKPTTTTSYTIDLAMQIPPLQSKSDDQASVDKPPNTLNSLADGEASPPYQILDPVHGVIATRTDSKVKRATDYERSWQYSFTTPLMSVSRHSRTYKVESRIHTSNTVETEIISVFYPRSGGKFLGLTSGMIVTARSTVGWQYTIEPFRAVPENALIFEFCRVGNMEGIKTLLQRGEASPMDRDPLGRTPLWIAANSLQLGVAKLLLQEGADPHAHDWRSRRPPIEMVARSSGAKLKPKVEMINILQSHSREDYSDDTILSMIGMFFLNYRPQKELDMPWKQRRQSMLTLMSMLLSTFHPGHQDRVDILMAAVTFYYEHEVLHSILYRITGPLDLLPDRYSILHEALIRRLLERDPVAMKMIVEKTDNLHRCTRNGYTGMEPHTPTMLAMYDQNLFRLWRNLLKELGTDMIPFVNLELEVGPLKSAGWTEDTLATLFETDWEDDLDDGPRVFGHPNCQRCGHNGTAGGARLKVDTRFRQKLRDVRQGTSKTKRPQDLASLDRLQITINSSDKLCGIWEQEDMTEEVLTSVPYRIVCSTPCQDGVCVAWAFDDVDEALVPESGPLKAVENCPTTNMPGAFLN